MLFNHVSHIWIRFGIHHRKESTARIPRTYQSNFCRISSQVRRMWRRTLISQIVINDFCYIQWKKFRFQVTALIFRIWDCQQSINHLQAPRIIRIWTDFWLPKLTCFLFLIFNCSFIYFLVYDIIIDLILEVSYHLPQKLN